MFVNDIFFQEKPSFWISLQRASLIVVLQAYMKYFSVWRDLIVNFRIDQ